jgi:hypothetical protein
MTALNDTLDSDAKAPEQGFLSPAISHYQQAIRATNQQHFRLVEEVNEFCQEMKYRLSPNNNDAQKVLAVCLYIKLLNDVQAAVLLFERGMASQGCSMLRVGLECLFILGKCCTSPEFFRAYISLGENQVLKCLRNIMVTPHGHFEKLKSEITPKKLEELKQIIGDHKDSQVEQWARDLGKNDLYQTAYRLLSGHVHSMPRAIDMYLDIDGNGELTEFICGPDAKANFTTELLEAGRLMLSASEYIANLFNIDVKRELSNFCLRATAMALGDSSAVEESEQFPQSQPK